MRRKHPYFMTFAAIAIFIMSLLIGCNDTNTPPDTLEVQQVFLTNRNDIQTVVDFLIESEFSIVHISDDSQKMHADLNEIVIDDEEVSAAIDRLLESYLSITKIRNTISMLQWTGVADIGCGIAYSVNGAEYPDLQFVTQLIPLTEDGWFYYVDDYNNWRNTP